MQNKKLLIYVVPRVDDVANTTRYQRVKHLSRMYQLIVISLRPFEPPKELASQAQWHMFKGGKLLFPFWFLWQIYSLVRREGRFAILGAYLVEIIFLCWIAKSFWNLTWIADIYDMPNLYMDVRSRRMFLKPLLEVIVGWCLRRADRVMVTLAPGALDQYRIPEDNMRFFTNGTDLSLPHAVVDWRYIGKKDHGLDVLYVGHVLRVRGLETVVDAARLAKDRGVSLRWTLIGPSNAQERRWLEKKISGLPVEYLGVLPHARSLQYIASADVCLCPFPRMMGTEFIYPIKVFEYMAFGKVVVATDLPGTRRIIENEKNGFLVPPENPEALVTTLSRLAMDADLRNRIGREAFISVRQYNWVRIHADFIKALEEALG